MTGWPQEYGRIILSEVGSTLDEAGRLAEDHAAPFWLLAHRQTAARGRRGRVWSMPDGNFAATLVLRVDETPARQALRSFVMSLALLRALGEATGQGDLFSLKWPNDVLLGGGKVAGILLESGGPSGVLAIGVGVNLARAPAPEEVEDDALRPVSVFEETRARITPEAFLQVLARHYAALERQFQDFGFAPIRSGWLSHAARFGKPITARLAREEITGTFEDVDPDGQLVLRGARGIVTIAAADVYF
ncbi:MAG: biotin--[acetyl-CoA-carboxylase] ligase [Roseobacter sp.]|jgi:BirA family biotin operon repressor/biotin-[acetyl-CoA-carboxylase] ligase